MTPRPKKTPAAVYPAEWRFAPLDPKQVEALGARHGLTDPLLSSVAQVLLDRGLAELTLFDPRLEHLEDASAWDGLPGWELTKAVTAVRDIAAAGGRVYIHGDSDTDGITATLVVERALQHYFPKERRLVHMPGPGDNYGFGMPAAEEALRFAADLVITLDCGTNNTEEVAYVAASGAQVIILDHHEIDEQRGYPRALMVNGKVLGRSANLKNLSSGGLAWRFACALHELQQDGWPENHDVSLAYVALSTVVDVMPLVGDNRVLVRAGLGFLNDINYATPTLIALRQLAKVEYERITLQAHDLGYKLGPILNLGKRHPHVTPQSIYDLLAYEPSAEKIAEKMREFMSATKERRDWTSTYKAAALEFIARHPQEGAHVRIAVVRHCPRGVVGLVANQLAEHCGMPAVVLTDDANNSEQWVGSGRSGDRLVDLRTLVRETGETQGGGGHAAAVGGIVVRKDALPRFRQKLVAAAGLLQAQRPDLFEGRIDVVCVEPLGSWNVERVEALWDITQPTGQGNRAPLFATGTCTVVEIRAAEWFTTYRLREGTHEFDVKRLGAGTADFGLHGKEVHALYEPQLYKGTLSFVAKQIRRTSPAALETEPAAAA